MTLDEESVVDAEQRRGEVDALVGKGVRFGSRRSEQAFAAYDDAIVRFGGDLDPEVARVVAYARLNRGNILRHRRVRRYREAVEVYEDLLARAPNPLDSGDTFLIGHALYGKGLALGYLRRYEEATRVFDAFVQRFRGSRAKGMPRELMAARVGRLAYRVLARRKR